MSTYSDVPLIPSSCRCTPWEAAGAGSVTWVLALIWETWIGFQSPDLGLISPDGANCGVNPQMEGLSTSV